MNELNLPTCISDMDYVLEADDVGSEDEKPGQNADIKHVTDVKKKYH